MSYIDEIFTRLNIQQLREFLLHGVDCVETSSRDYKQRLEEAWESVSEAIRLRFPDMEEYEAVTDKVDIYACVIQDVYMEIGLKCGAILAAQLLEGHCP
ncbi:MAG: hypothetical protein FWC62_06360 [Firmicutes bacterium]|nr:hypothetical protein [Bacillota bacterium]